MTTPFYKIVLGTAILAMSNLASVAQTNTIKPAYDFSLSREEKIKLADSAGPPEVSSKATVYVLDGTGYVKVRDGSNGFSCFVDRQAPVNLEPTCLPGSSWRRNARRGRTRTKSRLISMRVIGLGSSRLRASPESFTCFQTWATFWFPRRTNWFTCRRI